VPLDPNRPAGKGTQVVVNGIVPGGPAATAGVQRGDVVLEAAGEDVSALSAEEASSRIRGPPGSKLRIMLKRTGADEPVVLLIERAAVKLAATTSSVETIEGKKVGLVQIKQFSTSTADDVRKALEGLLPQKPAALVLDLRGNTGGYFTGGIDVARLLLGKGETINWVTDCKQNEVKYETYEDGLDTTTPCYVLVDDRTASASEILASALQDNGRAKLVGKDHTFGKAVIQTVSKLEDGSGIVVTTARYQTPKRTNINKRGIDVDIAKQCAADDPIKSCLPSPLV